MIEITHAGLAVYTALPKATTIEHFEALLPWNVDANVLNEMLRVQTFTHAPVVCRSLTQVAVGLVATLAERDQHEAACKVVQGHLAAASNGSAE